MTIQIESAEGHDGPAEFFDAAVERSARFDSQRAGIVDQWDGRGKQVRAGHIYGQGRSGQDALPNLGGCRTSTHRSGRLLGGVHWMAGSQLGAFLSPLESPARVSAFGRKCVRLCLLQYGCGRVGTARTPPLSILCRLVPSKRRNAQKGPTDDSGDVQRTGVAISGARGGRDQGRKGQSEAGCADLLSRDRNPESRAEVKITIEQPNPLIFQSFNQESMNQRITQSTNQLIKKASEKKGKKPAQVSIAVRSRLAVI